jgi:hypothetical protein
LLVAPQEVTDQADIVAEGQAQAPQQPRDPLPTPARMPLDQVGVGTASMSLLASATRDAALDASMPEEARMAAESQGDYVARWRAACERVKQHHLDAVNVTNCDEFEWLFLRWLECRGLSGALEYEGEELDRWGDRWRVYAYKRPTFVKPRAGWVRAYHGTWWYAMWNILYSGVLLQSDSNDRGHDFSIPGAYCAPRFETARTYARPHALFADRAHHRVVLELLVDVIRNT